MQGFIRSAALLGGYYASERHPEGGFGPGASRAYCSCGMSLLFNAAECDSNGLLSS